MSRDRHVLGLAGEEMACRELERRGYEILARRYRRRGGEVDIVAREGRTTVFVEVKTRDGVAFGGGGEAVNAFKRRRLTRVALDYVARHGLSERPCRFDVVAIEVSGSTPQIEVYQNAFDAEP